MAAASDISISVNTPPAVLIAQLLELYFLSSLANSTENRICEWRFVSCRIRVRWEEILVRSYISAARAFSTETTKLSFYQIDKIVFYLCDNGSAILQCIKARA